MLCIGYLILIRIVLNMLMSLETILGIMVSTLVLTVGMPMMMIMVIIYGEHARGAGGRDHHNGHHRHDV